MAVTLFVYGTLKDDGEPAELPGFRKNTSGPYPTIEPSDGDSVEGELQRVDAHDLAQIDRYEGYRPDSERPSLYVRMTTADGKHVYVGNPGMTDSWSYNLDAVRARLREVSFE